MAAVDVERADLEPHLRDVTGEAVGGLPPAYWCRAATWHLSLAVLEVLVHARVDQVRIVFHAFEIIIPDPLVEAVPGQQLPRAWDGTAIAGATREFGETWARQSRSVALSVPSVIVRQEPNVVLNPLHPEFAQLQISRPVRFRFDERLLRVSGLRPA